MSERVKRKKEERIADFLFEIGTMRKLLRMHRQTLLTDDMSDNIASHSYRVALIAWFLAKEEGVDPYKTVMMALIHDLDEVRTGDHNWVHKSYVKVFEDEIAEAQFDTLPYDDLREFHDEYEERETAEAQTAKDADLLDQILLLREYEWQGNEEAKRWLYGERGDEYRHHNMLQTKSAEAISKTILQRAPSDWWSDVWTPKRR